MKTRFLLLSFMAFMLFTAQAQIPSYVPSNGLIGWWPFNGNANDESGNGNNGTVNGATLSNDRNGIANSAYYFSSAGCATRIDFANFNYGGAVNSLSMSFWMNRVNDGCISPRLFEFGNGNGWGVSWINGQTSMDWVNNNNLQDNIWYHVIYVIQPGTISSYINGVFDSQSSINSPNFGLNVCFGRMNHPSYDAFNGNLDDIGIWNRALTECEIQDLYYAQLNSASLSISAGADQSICSGDNVTLSGTGGSNYQWNNNVVDNQPFTPAQSNAYVVTAQDSLGCTGTDTVVVTVLENATSTLTETSLDSYTLNGQTYTQSGTYTQTLTAANGCDSTITLNLTLNFTGIDELGTGMKKLVKITDLNGKTIPRRKNTLMLFIYEDGTVERVVELED